MLNFDPEDPFPLLAPDRHRYAEAQIHSAAVDAWLGLQIEKIESSLSEVVGQQLWVGLPVGALLTPYTELRALLATLAPRPGQTMIDLGAGYGRMAFVLARHYPEISFIGYEFVAERVAESRRCLPSHPRARMERVDLADPAFCPAPADYYFLYDYGTRQAIQKTLRDLSRIAATRPITVIGRGRASRDAIERQHPWLSQVHAPEHHAHYSIYRSAD